MRWRSRQSRWTRPVALALATVALAGCADRMDEEDLRALFDEGETLCLETRWMDARNVLREYLLHDSTNAGAHFYLGRAYLFSDDFRPAIAEGELQMALKLFIEGGRTSPIERFGVDYFEMICSIESAKVCLLQIDFMRGIGAPAEATEPIYDRAQRYVDAARKVMPSAADVKTLDQLLRGVQGGPTPQPSTTGVPTEV